ncbi:Tic22 family protein [Raphidiopsis curvata NIES-932]|nr:Tic22 family protein [Raphidiopsis curvata NIES-932]
MKSFIKSLVGVGINLGLIASTLGLTLSHGRTVFALPPQEIKGKLDAVPVYLITNDQGTPLSRMISSPDGKQERAMTDVYMSRQEALNFVQKFRQILWKDKNPKTQEMLKTLQVTTVPLGLIYQKQQQQQNQPNQLLFSFNPVSQEMTGAAQLMKASGQRVEQLKSVPIFMVISGKDKSHITIQVGRGKPQTIIPLFFSKQDAQNLLTKVKGRFPQAYIQVVGVDGLINTLTQKNDTWLKQLVLIPSPESRQHLNSLRSNSAQPKTIPPKPRS